MRNGTFSTCHLLVGLEQFHSTMISMRSLFTQRPRCQTRKFFHDASMNWARENPEAARKALAPPEFENSDPTVPQEHQCSFEHYWKHRGWILPNDHTKNLVTHVLTHPLTLAHYLNTEVGSCEMKSQHWCCVGARNESTLPHQYWQELLATLPRFSSLTLEFLGPEISPQGPRSMTHNDSTLILFWSEQKLLHQADLNPCRNGYVLFNPGLGHPHLKRGWESSLEVLFRQETPVLFTAHSKLDANRDATVLKERLEIPIAYMKNPFASRLQFQDPVSKEQHLVSSNQYACWIGTR
jgi:splicing suppressor protein 51